MTSLVFVQGREDTWRDVDTGPMEKEETKTPTLQTQGSTPTMEMDRSGWEEWMSPCNEVVKEKRGEVVVEKGKMVQ